MPYIVVYDAPVHVATAFLMKVIATHMDKAVVCLGWDKLFQVYYLLNVDLMVSW